MTDSCHNRIVCFPQRQNSCGEESQNVCDIRCLGVFKADFSTSTVEPGVIEGQMEQHV